MKIRSNYQFSPLYRFILMLPLLFLPPIIEAKIVANEKLISLDFQQIEVSRILQIIADFSQLNLVTTDAAKGHISLRLHQVTADSALAMILNMKNLSSWRQDQVLWIGSPSEIEQLKLTGSLTPDSSQMQLLHMDLNYAKAKDIEAVLLKMQHLKSANAKDQSIDLGLISRHGGVSFDERTNSLMIFDHSSRLAQIKALVQRLDAPIRQVMIEARIVRTSTEFSRELGVRWGIFSNPNRRQGAVILSGSREGLSQLRSSDQSTSVDQLNIDLGLSSPNAARLAMGLFNRSALQLDVELTALQQQGLAEIISMPKILTSDKRAARVATGQEIPFQTTVQSGSSTSVDTQFKQALLSLDVTPNITPDGRVLMDVAIKNDSANGVAPNGEIIIATNSMNSHVLVEDGETVVLGGIFQQQKSNDQLKVPWLSDAPIIGRLFRKDMKAQQKTELLIFITPRIINDINLSKR